MFKFPYLLVLRLKSGDSATRPQNFVNFPPIHRIDNFLPILATLGDKRF